MSKDLKVLLQHILESVENLGSYLTDVDEERFLQDIEKQDSVERRLQIIGEAIIQLPKEFKDKHSEIEWSKVAGLRNRLVHKYFDIDHLLIWNIINNSLPSFKSSIQKLIEIQK